jgi:hypothetical protein
MPSEQAGEGEGHWVEHARLMCFLGLNRRRSYGAPMIL